MIKQDKDKAREALAREEAKGQGFGPRALMWDVKDGDNKIRVMPPWTAEGPNARQCWREVYQHWVTNAEGNRRPILCPVKTPDAKPGQSCPICQYAEELRSSGDDLDKERYGDLRAKQRFFSNIVDTLDPVYTAEDLKDWKSNEYNKGKECPFEVGETKVQLWSYGQTIFTQLLNLVSDPQADILDFGEGYNIIVTKSGKKLHTEYKVRPEFKPSSFEFKSEKPETEWFPDLDKAGLLQFVELKELQNAVQELRLQAGGDQPALGAGQQQAAPGLPARGESRQTQQPKQQKQETPAPRTPAPPAEEDKPPCFGDKEIHSDQDAECTGGNKADEKTGKLVAYDPCPFFAECKKTIYGEPEAPPPRRGRRPAAAAGDGVADLEKQMRSGLKGG